MTDPLFARRPWPKFAKTQDVIDYIEQKPLPEEDGGWQSRRVRCRKEARRVDQLKTPCCFPWHGRATVGLLMAKLAVAMK
ncbi:MAG: hypothetical protein R3C10_26460 [Pirellulales bacterium]